MRLRGLSPEDRALIDAAVAAGMVRRFPMGLSGLSDQSFCWRAIRDQHWKNWQRSGKMTQQQQRQASRARTARRREELDKAVAALMQEGLTYRQMAARLGLAVSAVHRRAKRIEAQPSSSHLRPGSGPNL